MALFIESLFFNCFKDPFHSQPPQLSQNSLQQPTPNDFYVMAEKLIKNKIKVNNYQLTVDQSTKNILIRFIKIRNYKHFSLFFTLSINYQTGLLKLSAKILGRGMFLGKLQGSFRKKLQVKNTYGKSINESDFKLSINMNTGQIKLDSPFYFVEKSSNPSIEPFFTLFTTLITRSMYQLDPKLQFLSLILDQQGRWAHSEAKASQEKAKVNQIYRLAGLLNIYLNLTSETLNQEQDLIFNLHKQAESFCRLQSTRVLLDKGLNSINLYSPSTVESLNQIATKEQPLSYIERLHFQKRLELPSNKRCPNPNDNFYVLNYIKLVKKIPEGNLKKLQKGGFTTIYLTEVECWYVGSYCAGKKHMLELEASLKSPPLKKKIIIKREDKNSRKNGKSKVAHQIIILKNIKFGLSMFLPKFYLLAEKDDTYSNDLLVDYISTPNLRDYIKNNSHIMSMRTKLYIIMTIGQGLRYLKQYKIAHLDIKPSNIMTCHGFTFKLIDFGESYHPSLKNHQPGVSSPYSAPQNYSIKESYNHKNDVFSLGVIMYELLIGKYPFYFYDQVLRQKVFIHKTYLNHWFELPEDMLMYGEPMISPILYHIMRNCLHVDPEHRPELQWIVIILRECLDYFK